MSKKSMLGVKGYHGWLAVGIFALAAVFAAFPMDLGTMLLAVIGLFLGLTAITVKERTEFFLATLVLAVIGGFAFFGQLPEVGTFVNGFLSNLFAGFAPAAVLVAAIALFGLTKDK